MSLRRRNADKGEVCPGDLRYELGVTQLHFGMLLGISIVTVCRWENQKTVPTKDSEVLLRLLARAIERRGPDAVRVALWKCAGHSALDRLIVLVRLGDGKEDGR